MRRTAHPHTTLTRRAVSLIAAVIIAAGASLGCDPPRAATLPPGIPLPSSGARPEHPRDVRDVTISANGERLATLDGEVVHLWSLPSLEPVAQIRDIALLDFNQGARLSRDGRQLTVLDRGFSLWLWEEGVMPEATRVRVPTRYRPEHLLGFAPDGALLWISSRGEVVQRRSDDDISTLGRVNAVLGMAGDAEGGYFILTGAPQAPRGHWLRFDEKGVGRLDKVEAFWEQPVPLNAKLVVHARRSLAAWLDENLLFAIDTASERVNISASVARSGDHVSKIVLSPDGEWVVVAFDSGQLEWRSLRDGTPGLQTRFPARIAREEYPRRVRDLAFSDPHTLWVLLPEQRLVRYNTQEQRVTGDWRL